MVRRCRKFAILRKKGNKTEHLYPKFTTWRQQIDGKYWFPVYTRADDTLHFNLNDIHIREVVKYEDYKRFGSSVKILYQGQEIPKWDQKDQKTPPDQNQLPRSEEAGRAAESAAEVAVRFQVSIVSQCQDSELASG